MPTLKMLSGGVALLLLSTAVLEAQQAQYLMTSGAWKSYLHPGSEGVPLCGVETDVQNQSGDRGKIFLKFTKGGENIFLQLWKSSWKFGSQRIPVGATVNLDDIKLSATGYAYASNPSPPDNMSVSLVGFNVAKDYSIDFMTHFAEKNRLTIEFHEGNEPNWTSSLVGSREVAGAFAKCIGGLGGIQGLGSSSRTPTQPFNSQKESPTQPFSSRSLTQPFAPKGSPRRTPANNEI